MEYGARLAVALGLAGATRDSLAKALGVSVQAIGQVILGTTKAMTAENTMLAARFLGVSPFWLATGKETPRGLLAMRETLSDEAIAHAVGFEKMTFEEREQLLLLMAAAAKGRRQYLGGISGFGDLTGTE